MSQLESVSLNRKSHKNTLKTHTHTEEGDEKQMNVIKSRMRHKSENKILETLSK